MNTSYSAEDCYESIILECIEGFKALNELHGHSWSEKKMVFLTSAGLIQSWAEKLKGSDT